MAPIEITPVTGEILQVHGNEGGGFYDSGIPSCVGDPYLALPGSAVPGQVGVLDTGVPWFRLANELDAEWNRLRSHLPLVSGPSERSAERLDGAERFVVGAWTAAAWTLGHTRLAPASTVERPVTGAVIRDELSRVERVLDARKPVWEAAAGSLEWLLWITGAREVMPYPGWGSSS
jgi:hypothetical protein